MHSCSFSINIDRYTQKFIPSSRLKSSKLKSECQKKIFHEFTRARNMAILLTRKGQTPSQNTLHYK